MRWLTRSCATLIVVGFVFNEPSLRATEPPALAAPTRSYAFRVNGDGLLIDQKGTPVAVAEIPTYLKSLNISDITIVDLWVDGPEAIKRLTPTIQAFGGRFTKIIVKHWQPGDKVGLLEFPAPKLGAAQAAIAAVYPGRSYSPADLSQSPVLRPPYLQPGPIPNRVRYRYADNAVVTATAKQIHGHFITASKDSKNHWAGAVMVQSGAWMLFRSDENLGRNQAIRFTAVVPSASGKLNLQQIVLRDPYEIQELDSKVCQTIAAEGGGRIRALRSDEISTWWQYIAYDIIEPVFVLETANAHHRFIVGVNQDGIGMIDELNGLPILSAPRAKAGG